MTASDDEDNLLMWKRLVCDKSKEIDPRQEMDWQVLALGFFMGRGYSHEHAARLYRHAIQKGWF